MFLKSTCVPVEGHRRRDPKRHVQRYRDEVGSGYGPVRGMNERAISEMWVGVKGNTRNCDYRRQERQGRGKVRLKRTRSFQMRARISILADGYRLILTQRRGVIEPARSRFNTSFRVL